MHTKRTRRPVRNDRFLAALGNLQRKCRKVTSYIVQMIVGFGRLQNGLTLTSWDVASGKKYCRGFSNVAHNEAVHRRLDQSTGDESKADCHVFCTWSAHGSAPATPRRDCLWWIQREGRVRHHCSCPTAGLLFADRKPARVHRTRHCANTHTS